MEYSQTVNLPQTAFSMKANLAQKEPEMIKRWESIGIYALQQKKRDGAPSFVLHDGPPYANGEIHVGTAMNKILKDMILKYKFMRGFRTPYVPGWDCHGLPIELKVTEKLGEKAERLAPLTIRKECREFASKYVKIQMDGFKRLGVFADWQKPYLTMSLEYEASIVKAFGDLVEKGHVYRGMRPVHWCTSCNTSLAEAEIEYHDHSSPSIYVKFPVVKHDIPELKNEKVFVLIWTTTPWTLPANTGLSLNPNEDYEAVKVDGEYLIMASKLKDEVLAAAKKTATASVAVSHPQLKALSVKHCWIDRESRIVFGLHVTMDTGTGVVHTAPGHGMEDYIVGIENKLPQLSPVDDRGHLTPDVEHFAGLHVFEANDKIIEFLQKSGALYLRKDISHSYPHCWRCKNPIIFRSKPQWFFRVSDEKLQEQAVGELSKIKWIPEWGQTRIQNMLEGRPDWCLSRQRNWGVPIPAFYCEACGEAVLNKSTIDRIVGIVEQEGVDVWYQKTAEELMPAGTKCPKCGGTHFKKETDILDVWFDSGVSHLAVLDRRPELGSPADVYLEGNDQYRGWFQASLWPSVAIKGRAPYKTIITHGWTLDEQGKQMHKSLGNAVSPREVTDKFGADVLRLWVVSEDFRGDMRIGNNMISKCADAYRKIRNTFRYLLGNLDGFTPGQALPYAKMLPIDQFILAELYRVEKNAAKFNDNFEFYRSFREIFNFCAVELSSLYLDILKDRLYIYPKTSTERLSAQTALYHILDKTMRMLAPILPFTMEEVYAQFFKKNENDSIHLEDWAACPEEWKADALYQEFQQVLSIRELALKAVEELRSGAKEGEAIGSSLEAQVILQPKDKATRELLTKYAADLRYWLIVSGAEIAESLPRVMSENDNIAVYAGKTNGAKCARCWTYSPHVGKDPEHPELCERCAPIVKGL